MRTASPRVLRHRTLCAILAALLSCLFAAASPGQSVREIALIQKLGQIDYERAERQAEPGVELADDNAGPQLSSRDLKSYLQSYEIKFRKTAALIVKRKYDEAGASRIAKLRNEAQEIVRRADLTKEMIKDELDPIVDELEMLLLTSREDVLKQDATLNKLGTRFEGKVADDLVLLMEHTEITKALTDNPAHRQVIAANVNLRDKLDADEFKGTQALNRTRLLLGMHPLAIDEKLTDAARDHSKDMRERGFFSHTSPVPGKTSPWDRAKNFGTSASGENIALGSRTGDGAIRQWWYSPGHLKNMLGGHNRVGLGRFGDNMWTQLFGR